MASEHSGEELRFEVFDMSMVLCSYVPISVVSSLFGLVSLLIH